MITGDTLIEKIHISVFIADSSKGVLNGITLSGNFKFYNAPTGNYYIVLKHRNSIETWSAAPQSYTYLSKINFKSHNESLGSNRKVDAAPVRFRFTAVM